MITAEDLEKYTRKLYSATERVDGDYDGYSIGYDEEFFCAAEDVDLECLVDDLIAYKKEQPEVAGFLISSKLPVTYRDAPYCLVLESKELLCNLDAYPSILAKANANNIFFTLRVKKILSGILIITKSIKSYVVLVTPVPATMQRLMWKWNAQP